MDAHTNRIGKQPEDSLTSKTLKEILGAEEKNFLPGEKLAKKGAEALTDAELLAILISTGGKGHSATQIGEDIIKRYGSIEGMMNKPLEWFYQFKGLGDVKIIRMAAAFEIGRRLWGRNGTASSPRP